MLQNHLSYRLSQNATQKDEEMKREGEMHNSLSRSSNILAYAFTRLEDLEEISK